MKTFILFLFWLECFIQSVYTQCCLKYAGSTCVECPEGTHLFRGSCIFDVPNCLEYQNGFDCIQCQEGYSIDELNKICVKQSDANDTNQLPNTDYMIVHSSERNSTAIINLQKMAREIFRDQNIIDLFKVYVRRQDGDGIYRLIFSTNLGFLQTVILVDKNNTLRILDLTQKFEIAPDQNFIDLFSDPFFPSIEEYIERNTDSSSQIIDGFKKITTNQEQMIYRIFVLDTQNGLREFIVPIQITPTSNSTQILDIDNLEPILNHILRNLFTKQAEFKIQNAQLIQVIRNTKNANDINYIATYNERNVGNTTIQFKINISTNQINIIGVTFPTAVPKNCSVVIPEDKQPQNKIIAAISFKRVRLGSKFNIASIIPQKYYKAITDFRQKFYRQAMGGNIIEINVGQNSTAFVYQIQYQLLDAEMTTYFMQFVVTKDSCTEILQLNEIYSYKKSQLLIQNISANATSAQISKILQDVDKSLPNMQILLSFTYANFINKGKFTKIQVLNITKDNRRFSFVYELPQEQFQDISEVIFRLKKENSPTVKIIGFVEVPREIFEEITSPSPVQIFKSQIEEDFRKNSGYDFEIFMLVKTFVSQQNPQKYRLLYLVDKREIVTYQFNLLEQFMLKIVKREPYIDPSSSNSEKEDQDLELIQNSEIQSNITLSSLKRYTQEMLRDEIESKNLVFRRISRVRIENEQSQLGELFQVQFFNIDSGESLLARLFISSITSQIQLQNFVHVGGENNSSQKSDNTTQVEEGSNSTNNQTQNTNTTTEQQGEFQDNGTINTEQEQGQNETDMQGDNETGMQRENGTDMQEGNQTDMQEDNETDISENEEHNQTMDNQDNQTNNMTKQEESEKDNVTINSTENLPDNQTQDAENVTQIEDNRQEEKEKNLKQLADQVVYNFPDSAVTYKDLTNRNLSIEDQYSNQITQISLNQYSFAITDKKGITYNISQLKEQQQLTIQTKFIPQPISTTQNLVQLDEEISTLAISEWLRIPAIDLKMVKVMKKQQFTQVITRYTVSFQAQGFKMNRFVFQGQTKYPRWKTVFIKAYYDNGDDQGQDFLVEQTYGQIEAASEQAILLARMSLGNRINVKSQRKSTSSPKITMIDLRHYTNGRMRIFVNNLSPEQSDTLPSTLPTRPTIKNQILGIFSLDQGHYRTFNAKIFNPINNSLINGGQITDQTLIDIKFQIQAEILPKLLLTRQQPSQLDLLSLRWKNFENQIQKVRIFYQRKLNTSNSAQPSFLLFVEAVVDTSDFSIEITTLKKYENNLVSLRKQVEESKKQNRQSILSQLTFKTSFQRLQKTYGFYLIGFDIFRVESSEKNGQMFYRIIMINRKLSNFLQAIVAFDYSTEQSRVLSLSNFNKNELQKQISSQAKGCKIQKLSGQCTQCINGYTLNLDGNCYKKMEGCEIQSGSVCVACGAGFIGLNRNQLPALQCF